MRAHASLDHLFFRGLSAVSEASNRTNPVHAFSRLAESLSVKRAEEENGYPLRNAGWVGGLCPKPPKSLRESFETIQHIQRDKQK